jgi:nitrate reductase molybdenum cofactor assembly chaperone
MNSAQQETYQCFGTLLDYPGSELLEQARKCAGLLDQQGWRQAAAHIRDFAEYVESSTSTGYLEEVYTATFDVSPACFIFAGYLMFGEGFKRGKFLVRLQEKYAERGFSAGNELADHLAVIFRFMAILDPDEVLARELVEDCLIPVLEKMNTNFKIEETGSSNPYAQVLRAILMTLEHTMQVAPAM